MPNRPETVAIAAAPAKPFPHRRIAVIGAGVSGIAAAHVLGKFGYEVVIYERSGQIGGVWAIAYPEVRLQNVAEHYRLSDFPWPFAADQHPTAVQVRDYLAAAVAALRLDVRLDHDVTAMAEDSGGWTCTIQSAEGRVTEHFDHVVIAVGHFSDEKADLVVPGRERFGGPVISERDLRDLSLFEGRTVAVVGFGKTAVDLATFAAERGAEVHHIFRVARWLIPRFIGRRHMADVATARVNTFMQPSWVHPQRAQAWVHKWLRRSVAGYWKVTEWVFRASTGLHRFYRDPATRARMRLLEPGQRLTYQMRAAAALAPDHYYQLVREGAITPHRGVIAGFSDAGIVLGDGTEVAADLVVLAVGHRPPGFPFLPENHRRLMTAEVDGTQLYRHLLHPGIPNVAFAGFNHAFLHIPSVEVAMTWYGALIAGDIVAPPPGEMAASAARVAAWKRANTLFEPTRAYGIGNRIHQYLDVLLMELGVRHRRKKGIADSVAPYFAADYAGVFDEYVGARAKGPRPVLALDT